MIIDPNGQYTVPDNERTYRTTYSALALVQGIVSMVVLGISVLSVSILLAMFDSNIMTYIHKIFGFVGLGLCGLTLANAIVTTARKHTLIKWKAFNWVWFSLQMVIPVIMIAIPYDTTAQYGLDTNALQWIGALFIQMAFFGAVCLGYGKKASVGGMNRQLSIGMLIVYVLMIGISLLSLIFTGITKLAGVQKEAAYFSVFQLFPKTLVAASALTIFGTVFGQIDRDSELKKTIICGIATALLIALSVLLLIFNTQELVINNSIILIIVSLLAFIGSILGVVTNGKYLNELGHYVE